MLNQDRLTQIDFVLMLGCMPLYEYQCLNCEKLHEMMQKFSDLPLAHCPDCGGEVNKLISLSSFALKGSGWYTTDYKRAKAPAAQGEASTAASPPGAVKSDASTSSGVAAPVASTAPAVSSSEAKPASPVQSSGS